EAMATEAQQVMAENKIHHLPVVGDGKRLVGLLTRQRLTLEPGKLGSLNVWEIGRYLHGLKVKKIMIPAKQVYTIEPHRTIERAARYLEEHEIGCLPVIDEDNVVIGLITETDLLRSYQEMLGLPVPGVRVTMRMPDQFGEFNKLMNIMGQHELCVMGVGTYPTPRKKGYYDAVFKISKATLAEVKAVLGQVPGQEIVDIREAS
ncbi:MAG: CBS domain-containing protein, partial [Anaerolineae bacterium]|nr:CBS domain-containing protein [Anaerolineae bacterium]